MNALTALERTFLHSKTKIDDYFDVFHSCAYKLDSNLTYNRFHAKAEARAIAKEKAEEQRALADAVR